MDWANAFAFHSLSILYFLLFLQRCSTFNNHDEKFLLQLSRTNHGNRIQLSRARRSHVCWHVYGLLHRSDRNYNEAIKAYKQALKIDPENLQILRDMSLLQIQMRDLIGFRETRLRILTMRPNSKVHWLTYALSVHVCGDPEGAVGVLDSYMGTLEEGSVEFTRNFESSELALYKNRVLSETATTYDENRESQGGDANRFGKRSLVGLKKALDHLDEIKNVIVDHTGWLYAKLSYQLQLGMFDEAKDTCFALFRRGSTEDHRVHGAYMCALLKCDRDTCLEVENLKGMGTLATLRLLNEEERATLIHAYGTHWAAGDSMNEGPTPNGNHGHGSGGESHAVLTEGLATVFPKSVAIKKIYLALLNQSSEEFRTAVDDHCRRQLVKGVPSLGSEMSSFYLMKEKRHINSNNNESVNGESMQRLVLAKDPVDIKAHPVYQLLVELVDSYIISLSCQNTFPNETNQQPPSTVLWTWYLRSILHEQTAEYSQAITLINKCIEHTPTGVDFYELKARLLEAGGDIQQAADVVDAGRDLDHQDRYINNQTTKTLLRAGREEDAKRRIALFTRHEGNPEQNLYDMQCTWYELELADLWKRKGEFGRSLRKYSTLLFSTCFYYCFTSSVTSQVNVSHPLSLTTRFCPMVVISYSGRRQTLRRLPRRSIRFPRVLHPQSHSPNVLRTPQIRGRHLGSAILRPCRRRNH